ncbi:MAG: GPP34 family phosphoprotein, partial [Rickettsiales bacterium]
MDSISERLVLFALDNKHQTLIEKLDLRLGYGLSGALLLDLLDKGSIAYTDEGMLQAQMHDAPSAGYLQKALELLPRHAPSSHEGLSRTLYANMPMLKPLVLDALEQKGVLKSDEAKLKWSFAMKAYHVVDAHAGYREQLLAALLEDRLSIRDFWVLQFARSTELLWGGGQEKAEVLAAMERLEQLAGMVTHGRTLAQQMVEELPDAIAQAHRLGKMKGKRRYDEVWEWRGFWTEKGQTLIQASD